MSKEKNRAPKIITPDHWSELRAFTDARISLGRCGVSLPLRESLAFRLAHAQARDAVHQPLRLEALEGAMARAGHSCLRLASRVADRGEYLTRPDKGRRLSDPSRELLKAQKKDFDVCLVISDGLSSRAVHETAPDFACSFLALLPGAGLSASPVCLVENGRVAVADEIGELLGARLTAILIGERPGLSSPNSLGVYMTHAPKPGTTDEARNCISNVRPGGLSVELGVQKLAYLVENAFAMATSGVALKDKMTAGYLPFGQKMAAMDT